MILAISVNVVVVHTLGAQGCAALAGLGAANLGPVLEDDLEAGLSTRRLVAGVAGQSNEEQRLALVVGEVHLWELGNIDEGPVRAMEDLPGRDPLCCDELGLLVALLNGLAHLRRVGLVSAELLP